MRKPPERDLFATLEDDLRQFRNALFATLRAAPGGVAKRVGQITPAIRGSMRTAKEARGTVVLPSPAQHNDLLPKHQDLCFRRRP